MLSAAEFYAAFDAAGFLVPSTWTPQPGGTPVEGQKVRFRRPTLEALGDGGIVPDPHAQWPSTQYVGAKRNDRLDITDEAGVTSSWRIRELHRLGTGAQVRADLAIWA